MDIENLRKDLLEILLEINEYTDEDIDYAKNKVHDLSNKLY